MLRLYASLFALATFAGLAAAQEELPQRNVLLEFFPFIIIIIIFYFLLIRPQQQRQKKHREMIQGLKKHDEIVTQGGLVGKITKVDDTILTVELAEGVRVKLIKSMVVELRNPKPANDS